MMLTEICAVIKNYFTADKDKHIGDFSVSEGVLVPSVPLHDGQYYRIVGSVFNDGVHKFGDVEDILQDEPEFHGAVWAMRVPQEVVQLAQDIKDWQDKYGTVDSANMSPYSSESFGGYSYHKAQGFAETGGGMLTSWNVVFASRLNPWRKIRP